LPDRFTETATWTQLATGRYPEEGPVIVGPAKTANSPVAVRLRLNSPGKIPYPFPKIIWVEGGMLGIYNQKETEKFPIPESPKEGEAPALS